MRVLVVGGGSVGLVLAWHLHRAGRQVTVLRRNAGGDREVVLYSLNAGSDARTHPRRFSSFESRTLPELAGLPAWRQAYFCVPSTALDGDLLGGVQDVIGDASVIKLQSGLRDRAAYLRHFEASRLVTGMLSLLAYPAPLPGEQVPEPGTAFWFPPGLPSRFSGDPDRVREVVGALQAGGFPARRHPDVERLIGYVMAVEVPLTAGLACAGWSIRAFTNGRWLGVACEAIREATAVVSGALGTRAPWMTRLVSRATLRLAAALLPRRRPLPMEAYLQFHFTKLGAQSARHLDDYLHAGIERGLAVVALRQLKDALRESA